MQFFSIYCHFCSLDLVAHNPKVVGSNPAAATRKLALCNAMGKWLRNPQRLHSANIFCLYFGENRGLWNKNLCRISDLKTIFWGYVANVFFLSCDMKNGFWAQFDPKCRISIELLKSEQDIFVLLRFAIDYLKKIWYNLFGSDVYDIFQFISSHKGFHSRRRKINFDGVLRLVFHYCTDNAVSLLRGYVVECVFWLLCIWNRILITLALLWCIYCKWNRL